MFDKMMGTNQKHIVCGSKIRCYGCGELGHMSKDNPVCYCMMIKKSKGYQRKKMSVQRLPQKEKRVFNNDVEESVNGGDCKVGNGQDQREKT